MFTYLCSDVSPHSRAQNDEQPNKFLGLTSCFLLKQVDFYEDKVTFLCSKCCQAPTTQLIDLKLISCPQTKLYYKLPFTICQQSEPLPRMSFSLFVFFFYQPLQWHQFLSLGIIQGYSKGTFILNYRISISLQNKERKKSLSNQAVAIKRDTISDLLVNLV